MKYRLGFFKTFFCIILLSVIWTKDAHAYLDPGTGSYIIQIVIAGIFAGWLTIKVLYRKVINFFSKLFSSNKKNDTKEKQ